MEKNGTQPPRKCLGNILAFLVSKRKEKKVPARIVCTIAMGNLISSRLVRWVAVNFNLTPLRNQLHTYSN